MIACLCSIEAPPFSVPGCTCWLWQWSWWKVFLYVLGIGDWHHKLGDFPSLIFEGYNSLTHYSWWGSRLNIQFLNFSCLFEESGLAPLFCNVSFMFLIPYFEYFVLLQSYWTFMFDLYRQVFHWQSEAMISIFFSLCLGPS